jgi:hypothetical protein
MQALNASYMADMVSCAKAAGTVSGAEEDEDKEKPRDNAGRDAWP